MSTALLDEFDSCMGAVVVSNELPLDERIGWGQRIRFLRHYVKDAEKLCDQLAIDLKESKERAATLEAQYKCFRKGLVARGACSQTPDESAATVARSNESMREDHARSLEDTCAQLDELKVALDKNRSVYARESMLRAACAVLPLCVLECYENGDAVRRYDFSRAASMAQELVTQVDRIVAAQVKGENR